MGEAYDGPVLFEAPAAAQLFGQLLGDNLKITRKPFRSGPTFPYIAKRTGKQGGIAHSAGMDGRGGRSHANAIQGHTLLGHYLYDMEGVAPKPLKLVEKGVLKNFLLTRTPVFKDFPDFQWTRPDDRPLRHAFAWVRQLFIRVSQNTTRGRHEEEADRLVPAHRTSPTASWSASWIFPPPRRLRITAKGRRRPPADTVPWSQRLLAYKIYPDGREELVRNLRSAASPPDRSKIFWRPPTNSMFSISSIPMRPLH